MPALQNNRGPIWYHIWLDVRHIPIAIYRIISNGSYMLITFAMAVDGMFKIEYEIKLLDYSVIVICPNIPCPP